MVTARRHRAARRRSVTRWESALPARAPSTCSTPPPRNGSNRRVAPRRTDVARRRRWRDAPLALAMLAPSLVDPRRVRAVPVGPSVVARAPAVRSPPATNCRSNGWDQYVDVFRSEEFQQAFGVTFRFALLTVPVGLALGVGLAVLVDKQLRGMGILPHGLLVHSRHQRRRRVAHVVLPPQPQRRRARRLDRWGRPRTRACCRTRTPRCGPWRSAASGPTSASRSSSSRPGCRASRPICTRARTSTARVGGCGSPT